MKDKIFCRHCCYFVSFFEDIDKCSSNPQVKLNWYGKYIVYARPAEKNRGNDCPEYKEKRNIFKILFERKRENGKKKR